VKLLLYCKLWASSKCGNAGLTSSTGILMVGSQLFRSIRGRDISPILLRQIAKDIGLTVEEFLKHR